MKCVQGADNVDILQTFGSGGSEQGVAKNCPVNASLIKSDVIGIN